MTVPVDEYFRNRTDDRKKQPRYLAFIDKDSCTSCGACAAVCPVDCIFEVPSPVPSESFHQIDTARCIGCQLCYRSPQDSTRWFTLTVCPWNAIDLLHNPSLDPSRSPELRDLWRAENASDMPWAKLEECAYALHLSGEIFVPAEPEGLLAAAQSFAEPVWRLPEGIIGPLAQCVASHESYCVFRTTSAGRSALRAVFRNAARVFLG